MGVFFSVARDCQGFHDGNSLNHNPIEAVLLGAAAYVKVEGDWNNDLMEQVQKPGPIKER
jgi:hypothetical protein